MASYMDLIEFESWKGLLNKPPANAKGVFAE